MSKTQQQVDEGIDAFVGRVNGSPREPLPYDEVPEFLREPGTAASDGWTVPWTIRPALPPCAWIESFEAKLPGRLPRSYKSLVTRYLFPAFQVGRVMLFANTGAGVHNEVVEAVFRDRFLSGPLLAAGFVQFGRPDPVNYDPVCFDLNRRSNDGECPVVRLDHEALLISGRVHAIAELARSFLVLVGS